jgi:hypothetical protein
MVDDWVNRYKGGESLKQIAKGKASPSAVFLHLRARGIQLRDKLEAQIKATTKHPRLPFSGDRLEKAYLMGIRYGDLHVVRHGRAIRVRVSTTHPAMANLFESLFSPYGHVQWYPRRAKLVGHEWTLECDLAESFDFLLSKLNSSELAALPKEEMIAFLAGLFDAEGSVVSHIKRGRANPEAVISNTDEDLLDFLVRSIKSIGFYPKLRWGIQKSERSGISGYSRRGQITLWRFQEAQAFLRMLPLRHREKVAKRAIIQKMTHRGNQANNLIAQFEWAELVNQIKRERNEFISLAGIIVKLRQAARNGLF